MSPTYKILCAFTVGTTGRAYSITGGYTGVRRNFTLQAIAKWWVVQGNMLETKKRPQRTQPLLRILWSLVFRILT
ncbi:hypothetical protein ACIQD3_13900 [Peribacillus loiseleuriae]|uniref:hypothetical protein n=1 Tax=Peribacillus loiseleuriae TaxID=1679170 RepID=UPI0038193595